MKTGADGARKPRLLARSFLGQAHMEVAEALEMVGLEASAICPSAICRPARSRAAIAPGCWSTTVRSGCSTSRPPGWTSASEAQFAAKLMKAHLEDGGMVVAATHLPLGLEGRAVAGDGMGGANDAGAGSPMLALYLRDLKLGVRAGGGALTGVLFFLAVIATIPSRSGPT
jgi:hypothetical protein